MITKSIIYSESRESYSSSTGLKSWIKIGVEVELSPGDNVDDAINYAKEIVKGEMMYSQPPEQILEQVTTIDKRIGVTVEDIMSCEDTTILMSYKFLVRNKPELEEAFSKRLKQLS